MVTLTDVQLNAAVEESLSLVAHQIELQGIHLEKRLEGSPVVRADYGQLRQACVNISLNACDAMSRGGTLQVACAADPSGPFAELRFSDSGVGISDEDLSRIFDPFFTTKERGTGLGLSVVYGIVERIGGTIDVRSQVGVGTTVTLRLPLSQPTAAGVA